MDRDALYIRFLGDGAMGVYRPLARLFRNSPLTAAAECGRVRVRDGRSLRAVAAGWFIVVLLAAGAIAFSRTPKFSWLPDTYTQPLLAIFSMMGLSGLVWRKPGWGWAALCGFMLVAWPPVEWLLSRPLEASYPVRPFRPPPGVGSIVVLSSAVEPAVPERPYSLPDRATLSRCEFAAWIYRNWPQLPVLVSGGSSGDHAPSLAAEMRELLLRAGVPGTMIWTEDRSRNTYENAAYCAEILRSRGIRKIVLVVDARNMFRASACFRKQGIGVAPAPSSSREWAGIGHELMPNWQAIAQNERTLHEIGGVIWYRLHGWI